MRLKDLSKSQAKELQRLWDLLRSRDIHRPKAHLEKIRTFISRLPDWAQSHPDDPETYLRKRMNANFSGWAGDVFETSIGLRFYDDDTEALQCALMQAARLDYLASSRNLASSGQDCLHIKKMFVGLAAADWAVADAYMTTIPGPSTKGHKASMRNVNLLYDVLQGKTASAEASAADWAKNRDREKQVYDQALTDGLCAIVLKDTAKLAGALGVLVAKHARQQDLNLGGMGKFFCYPAHALYNIATQKAQMEPASIDKPKGATWDSAFQDMIDTNRARSYSPLIDYAPANPHIAQWLKDLPPPPSPRVLMA